MRKGVWGKGGGESEWEGGRYAEGEEKIADWLVA